MLGILGLLGICVVGMVFLPLPRADEDEAAATDGAEDVDWSDFANGELLAFAEAGTAGGPADGTLIAMTADTGPTAGDADAAWELPDDGTDAVPVTAHLSQLAIYEAPDEAAEDVDAAAEPPLVIEGYAPGAEALVLLYDGTGPEPEVTWDTSSAGIRVFADGALIALLKGVDDFDRAELALLAE